MLKSLEALLELPINITPWVELLMDGLIGKQESLPAPTLSKMGTLLDGGNSWPSMVSNIFFCLVLALESASSLHLKSLYTDINMTKQGSLHCQAKPFVQQSIMYVCNLEQTFGIVQT